ncbi:CinA family protein [Phenylobacterium sp. LjRoot219]|uniref:CinA family protein n=1 Tax=Phenylobacterium sp. LjRoot219 TaxID=3342283 RepID=UPI003ECDF9A2
MYIGKAPERGEAPEWPPPIASTRIAVLAGRVLTLAGRSSLRIATAESCTGGLLASLLSDAGDQSEVFERGFIVDTDAAKHDLLGLPLESLRADGPVSETAALLMAEAALARSGADIALSTTGWLEQGPELRDAAGMVWFGCVRRGEPTWTRLAQFGDIGRAPICRGCLGAALELALSVLRD